MLASVSLTPVNISEKDLLDFSSFGGSFSWMNARKRGSFLITPCRANRLRYLKSQLKRRIQIPWKTGKLAFPTNGPV